MGMVVFLIGLIGIAFGAWGIYTPEGRIRFDEMDGIYPMASGAGGCILIIIALGIMYYRKSLF